MGLASGSVLLAQVHAELIDAGELPGALLGTSGVLPAGPVTQITGTLTQDDRDMYSFFTAGGVFSATVATPSLGPIPDSQLFLFDSAGRGLLANDDYLFLSGPSQITTNLAAGQYFLAISAFDDDPINEQGLIFPTFPDDELIQVGPFVVGGPPITGWIDTGTNPFTYTINLTNAFGSPPDGGNGNGNGTGVPDTSSSLLLLSMAMLSLVAMRRRCPR